MPDSHSQKLLVVIAGPTAVGKSAFAIALAKQFHTSVISADSRQIFKEIPIGTAQPSKEELEEVKHYFIGSHSVFENYTAGQYQGDVTALLKQLFMENNVVIMCGGSGLYIDAVLNGIDEFPPVPEEVRNKLNEALETHGISYLQEKLKETDPEYYKEVDLNNPRRIIRALEVSIAAGQPFSSFRTRQNTVKEYNVLKIALNRPREILYDIINRRVDAMIQSGLQEEAMKYYQYKNINALQTVGYKEIFEHADGRLTFAEAIDKIKQHSRNYAKRQLTWFKKDPEYHWFEPSQLKEVIALIEENL